MKTLERDKAIELRRQGMTFSEILKEIPIFKGNLNYWLKDIKLTSAQLSRTEYKNQAIKETSLNLMN